MVYDDFALPNEWLPCGAGVGRADAAEVEVLFSKSRTGGGADFSKEA